MNFSHNFFEQGQLEILAQVIKTLEEEEKDFSKAIRLCQQIIDNPLELGLTSIPPKFFKFLEERLQTLNKRLSEELDSDTLTI